MTAPTNQAHQQLRAWAAGDLALEAATELMITASHGRFVQPEWPWMHPTTHGQWIDFSTIPVQIGPLSGGEQRLLRIAASIGSPDTTVNLHDCLALDRTSLQLVLKAVAHACGHPNCKIIISPDGRGPLATTGSAKAVTSTSVPAGRSKSDAGGSRSL